MKKKLSVYFLIAFSIILLRGKIFNLLIKYEVDVEIPTVELTDPYWIDEINNIGLSNSPEGILEFNDRVLQLVASKLRFGKNQTIHNPNDFRESTAHCVGYAALNASLLDYFYKSTEYEISHVRGRVYFLGFDLTKLSKSKFWRNHDFVRIKNKHTNHVYYSDGPIFEYLRISRIRLEDNID